MNLPDIIYAMSEHERPDLPWPLAADRWYWSLGDQWVAVYSDFHEDWWADGPVQRPQPCEYPIGQTPPGPGTLHYRDAVGNEQRQTLEVAA